VLTNPLGRIAIGDDFFDHEKEQKQIWSLLRQGNNLLLVAPRRVGKSSLLKRLKERANDNGLLAAYVTVPDITSEILFLKRLLGEICDLDGSLASSRGTLVELSKKVTKIGPINIEARPRDGGDRTIGGVESV